MKKDKKIKFTEEEWAELNNTPSYEEWKKLFNDISKTTNKIMTTKQKAEQLFNWFLNEGLHSYSRYQSSNIEDREGAKFCALKTIDEVIEATKYTVSHGKFGIEISEVNEKTYYIPYWQEVKQEIEKL